MWTAAGAVALLLFVAFPAVAADANDGRSFRHIVFDPDDPHFDQFLFTNYLNTAFDTAQVTKAFSQDDYWRNHIEIFDILVDPFDAISDAGGWDEFFRQEFLSSHALPNFTLHLLGNGYDSRVLAEWYDSHGVPYPFLWAFLSSYAGYIGNEAIEASNSEMDALDHLADLYLFNLAGNLLFMNDRVADFTHNTLQLRNWTGQPFFDTRSGEVLNATNNYVLRPALWGQQVRPLLYFGLHYFGGVSVRLPDATALSVAGGLAATDPLRETNAFSDNLDKVRLAGGLFWDRDDRLLASLVLHGTQELLVRANVYPEIFDRDELDLGFYFGIADNGMPSFGMIVHKVLALGFG